MQLLLRSGIVLVALFAVSGPARADHRATSNTIVGFYQQYLKRSPAPREVESWFREMRRKGLSLREVEAGILGSREYYERHHSDRSWARGLFVDALDQNPSPADVRHWAERLRQSGGNYSQVALEFLSEVRGWDGFDRHDDHDDRYDYRPRRPYPQRVPPGYHSRW